MPRKLRKPIRFHFDDPIYCCRIFVSAGEDLVGWEQRMTKILGASHARLGVAGRCLLPESTSDCAVWFDGRPGAGIVSHEAFHLTCHILYRAGLVLDEESEEAFAYHLAWVVRMIGEKAW